MNFVICGILQTFFTATLKPCLPAECIGSLNHADYCNILQLFIFITMIFHRPNTLRIPMKQYVHSHRHQCSNYFPYEHFSRLLSHLIILGEVWSNNTGLCFINRKRMRGLPSIDCRQNCIHTALGVLQCPL